MGTKGGGAGGGGEGEGVIQGTGDVDVGGAGSSNRKKKVKGNKRPQEKKVAVRTGTAQVKGQLSKELIDREVRRHRAQITFCYNKQLLRHPKLSGKVILRWIITMDGSVRGAKVKSSSLGNKDAESCMVRALESWKFPKPEGGVVQVDYPFIFGTQ
jgi:TonB family protein